MESVNCGDSDCRRGAVNFPTVKVFHINYIYNIVIDIDGEQKESVNQRVSQINVDDIYTSEMR